MLRLSTASLAGKVGFDVEKIEDIKVVVSEIFTYLLTDNDRMIINFELMEDSIKVIFDREKFVQEEGLNDASLELKKQILLTLTDDLKLDEDKITILMNRE